jgi:hypothetical protein
MVQYRRHLVGALSMSFVFSCSGIDTSIILSELKIFVKMGKRKRNKDNDDYIRKKIRKLEKKLHRRESTSDSISGKCLQSTYYK